MLAVFGLVVFGLAGSVLGGRINGGLVFGWLWVGVLEVGLVFWWLDWCLSEFFLLLLLVVAGVRVVVGLFSGFVILDFNFVFSDLGLCSCCFCSRHT